MKKLPLLIFSALLLLTGGVWPARILAHTFTYNIAPASGVENQAFRITISFQAGTNQSVFDFPLVWGSDEIPEYIHLDTVGGASGYTVLEGSPRKLEIKHPKGSRIRVTYTVKNTVDGETFRGGDTFFPLIKPDHFYCFSNSIFLVPETEASCNFYLNWMECSQVYPQSPVTSIGTGYQQEMKGVMPIELQNLVVCAGDFRILEKQIGKHETIQLAIRGKWDFTDSAMMDMITNTIIHQRSFWNDHSTPRYLVVMVPVTAQSEFDMSFQGTGLRNSFTVAVTQNKNAQPATLGYLFHHELMHHWIGNKIQNGRDEELSYWFSEGFTDYFARMNMYHCGLLDKQQYIQTLDSLFSVQYSDSSRQAHNDSIKVHFWDDRMYGKLPYDRGALFAYYADLYIRKNTGGKKSLKNVMQDMLKHALKRPRPFDTVWFTQTVKKIGGIDLSDDIHTFMISGQFIPLDAWNRVSPGLLEVGEGKIFDLGFEVNTGEIKKGSVVTLVKPGTGAFSGGLEEGDVLQGFSVYYGRVDYPAELTVLRNGKALDITFYPYAVRSVPLHKK